MYFDGSTKIYFLLTSKHAIC